MGSFFERLEGLWVSRDTPVGVSRADYGAGLLFGCLIMAAPVLLVWVAYQAGVHEFFDPQTLTTVAVYAPYGAQVGWMVGAVVFFLLCYVLVLWGLVPATARRYKGRAAGRVAAVLLVVAPVPVALVSLLKPTPRLVAE